jgi:Uma2 family endonuclease
MSSTSLAEKRGHRLSVGDYYRMAEAGILAPDARVELIEGEVLDMAPIGTRRNGCVNFLSNTLVAALHERAIVQTQGPIRLDEYSEPQPDLALLRPRPDFYGSAHPTPADVLLVSEVADTTLAFDRDVKVPIYARFGIPEVWLVDIEAMCCIAIANPPPAPMRAWTARRCRASRRPLCRTRRSTSAGSSRRRPAPQGVAASVR